MDKFDLSTHSHVGSIIKVKVFRRQGNHRGVRMLKLDTYSLKRVYEEQICVVWINLARGLNADGFS